MRWRGARRTVNKLRRLLRCRGASNDDEEQSGSSRIDETKKQAKKENKAEAERELKTLPK